MIPELTEYMGYGISTISICAVHLAQGTADVLANVRAGFFWRRDENLPLGLL